MSGQFSSKQTLGFCRIIKWALDKRFYPIRNTPPPGGVGYRLGQFTRGSQYPAGISNGIYFKGARCKDWRRVLYAQHCGAKDAECAVNIG